MKKFERPRENRFAEKEIAEVEKERKAHDIFVQDIKKVIEFAIDQDRRRDDDNSLLERQRNVADLLKKAFDYLSEGLREDPDFYTKILSENKNLFSFDRTDIVIKSFLESAPVEVKSDLILLDLTTELWQGNPLEYFLNLSEETVNAMPDEWFREAWSEAANLEKKDDYKIAGYFSESNLTNLPWGKLSEEQKMQTMDRMNVYLIDDFSKIPHQLRDGYEWNEIYNRMVHSVVRDLEYSEWGSGNEENVLKNLSKWPDIYKKNVEKLSDSEADSIKEAIRENIFYPGIIKGVIDNTELSFESEEIKTLILEGIDHVITENKTRAIELVEFLPELDAKNYIEFFSFSAKSHFTDDELSIAFIIWKNKLAKGEVAEDDYSKIRDQVLRRVYNKQHKIGKLVKESKEEYARYLIQDPDSDELLWNYLSDLDRAESFATLLQFINVLKNNEQENKKGHRSNADLLKRVLSSVKSSDDANVVVEFMKLFRGDDIDKITREGEEFNVLRFVNQRKSEEFLAKYQVSFEDKDFDDWSYIDEMEKLKKMRLYLHEMTDDRYIDELREKIADQIKKIRQVKEIERDALSIVPGIIRDAYKDKTFVSEREIYRTIFDKYNLGSRITKHTRQIVQKKIKEYWWKQYQVTEYLKDYRDNPAELLKKAIYDQRDNEFQEVEMMAYGVSLIFAVSEEDYSKIRNKEGAHKSAAVAYNYSPVYKLSGTIVLLKKLSFVKDLHDPYYMDTIVHENRHQEDMIIFETKGALLRSKTEILAYMSENRKASEIVEILTDVNGLYYYKDVQDRKKWQEHVKKVKQMVKIAEVVKDLDLLAVTPVNEWRKLLPHPSAI